MKFAFEQLKSIGRNLDKKETVTRWNLIAFHDGKFIELITARWYMGRSSHASVVYCTVWFHSWLFANSHGEWTDASGTGQAGGGGYCKQSAAFESAMRNAGIKCDHDISGRGMSVAEDALLALGRQAGYEHVKLVRG
jgi:hypothetical protein